MSPSRIIILDLKIVNILHEERKTIRTTSSYSV
jgi:hypothetical protein